MQSLLGFVIFNICLEDSPTSKWEDFTWLTTARQDQKCKSKTELKYKRMGAFFLLVMAVGRVYSPTNLRHRNCARSFYVGNFPLSTFPLPLTDPEYHRQSWHVTRRAL